MDNEKKGWLRRSGEYLGFVNTTQPVEGKRDVAGMASGVMPPARSDIASASVEQALSVGAVYRAVSIITASVSQMGLGVYRNGIELPLPTLIRQPNINDSQTRFIEETVWSLATYGNAYWRLYGEPVQNVEVLDPTTVTVVRENGQTRYWIGSEQIPASRIRHLKLMSRPGQPLGYGPIQLGNSEIIGAMRLRQFADNWFNTSGVPTGVLSTDQTLSGEEAKLFADAWANFVRNNGTAVLSSGMNYSPINIKPAEAQFLEVQQAQTVAIARLFGIPAMHLLAELSGTSNTYLNLEQANMVFLQTTLVKYMNEIEEALSSLLPRGQSVQFKEEGLLRMDSVTKWNVIKTQADVGYTSGDELRALEGKAPLPTPNSNEDVEA